MKQRTTYHHSNTTLIIIVLAALLAGAGCEMAAIDAPPEGTTAPETTTGDDDECPPEACGFNSSQLADVVFGELDLHGQTNSRGIAIADFLDPRGRSLLLDIEHGALVGLDPDSGASVLRGPDLAGSRIVMHREQHDGSLSEWILTVHSAAQIDYMSDQPGSIPAYRMTYAAAFEPEEQRSLCPDSELAVVAIGERYDPVSLAIHGDDSRRWFRIACQEHVLGKARRMSYDPGFVADHPYHTTPARRRATLAMLAADYCGTGERFTRPGTALTWQNREAWMIVGAPLDDSAPVEAAWNEHGAACLNTPRLSEIYRRADIEARCGFAIPRCSPEILAGSEWITWIP